MKDKILHYIKEIIIFTIVITLFANAISYYKSSDLNKSDLPRIEATLLNGTHYTIEAKKPLLIHFWATWCPTCKLEIDNIQRVSEDYEVVTIAVQSGTNEEIQKYLLDKELTLQVINDSNGMLAKKFNIAGYPTTFIYDEKGKLTFSEVGYTSSLGLYLRMWWTGL